jgi:hypothetical protein
MGRSIKSPGCFLYDLIDILKEHNAFAMWNTNLHDISDYSINTASEIRMYSLLDGFGGLEA